MQVHQIDDAAEDAAAAAATSVRKEKKERTAAERKALRRSLRAERRTERLARTNDSTEGLKATVLGGGAAHIINDANDEQAPTIDRLLQVHQIDDAAEDAAAAAATPIAAGEDGYLVSEGVAVDVEAGGFALPGVSVGGARDATLFENSGAPAQFDVDDDVSERWAKVFSTTNQAFYWRHDTTGEMTWDKPQGWVEPGLPVGWTEVPDMASGHSYYHNASTDSTQWKHPHGELP